MVLICTRKKKRLKDSGCCSQMTPSCKCPIAELNNAKQGKQIRIACSLWSMNTCSIPLVFVSHGSILLALTLKCLFFRWVSSIMLQKRLMCSRDWILIRNTGKEKEEHVLESFSKSLLATNQGKSDTN